MRKKDFINEVQTEAKGLVAHAKIKEKGFDRSYKDFECYYYHKKRNIKTNCHKLKEKKGNVKFLDAVGIQKKI